MYVLSENILKIIFFPTKFSFFAFEKKSPYITWACFRMMIGPIAWYIVAIL